MKQKSMTALVSAFARAYHSEHNAVTVFDDRIAKKCFKESTVYGVLVAYKLFDVGCSREEII